MATGFVGWMTTAIRTAVVAPIRAYVPHAPRRRPPTPAILDSQLLPPTHPRPASSRFDAHTIDAPAVDPTPLFLFDGGQPASLPGLQSALRFRSYQPSRLRPFTYDADETGGVLTLRPFCSCSTVATVSPSPGVRRRIELTLACDRPGTRIDVGGIRLNLSPVDAHVQADTWSADVSHGPSPSGIHRYRLDLGEDSIAISVDDAELGAFRHRPLPSPLTLSTGPAAVRCYRLAAWTVPQRELSR